MPIKQAAGIVYALTAIVSGYWEMSLILRPTIGGPWSWWYMIMLSASVLLLIGGVHVVAPQMKSASLVVLSVVVSLVLWSLFRDSSWVWLVFSIATAAVTWGVLTLASTFQRDSLVAAIAGAVLAAWWISASVRTLITYFSPSPSNPGLAGLVWTLTPVLLITASAVIGVLLSLHPTPRAIRRGGGLGGEPIVPPTSTTH
jgi:hypothetical protein